MPAEAGRSTAVDAHLAWISDDWRQLNLAPLVTERSAAACTLISPVALIFSDDEETKTTQGKRKDAVVDCLACGDAAKPPRARKAQTRARGTFFALSPPRLYQERNASETITCHAHFSSCHWLIYDYILLLIFSKLCRPDNALHHSLVGLKTVTLLIESPLEHDNTDTAHVLIRRQVLVVDSARDKRRTVVVKVVVQLAVSCTKLLLLEEQRVVEKGKSIQDIEFGLRYLLAKLL